jgi:hypothetical protein
MANWFNLFKNDRKEDGDTQPLYKNAKVVFDNDVTFTAGIPYEVALWKKDTTNSGKPTDMVSIKIEPNTFLIDKGEIKVEETEQAPF